MIPIPTGAFFMVPYFTEFRAEFANEILGTFSRKGAKAQREQTEM
jgi:hypothetical protein